MPAVLIRDLPPAVLDALKRRAARQHRSLQKELVHLLTAAAEEAPPEEPLPPLRLRLSRARPRSKWRREELYGDDGR
jgi:plasmid stability protein